MSFLYHTHSATYGGGSQLKIIPNTRTHGRTDGRTDNTNSGGGTHLKISQQWAKYEKIGGKVLRIASWQSWLWVHCNIPKIHCSKWQSPKIPIFEDKNEDWDDWTEDELKEIFKKGSKVRDHCHFTGKFRGAAKLHVIYYTERLRRYLCSFITYQDMMVI